MCNENGSRIVLNYRGAIFVSVEDADGCTLDAQSAAVVLYDKLKADYDAENKINCLECAKANNINPPETQKPAKGSIDSVQSVA